MANVDQRTSSGGSGSLPNTKNVGTFVLSKQIDTATTNLGSSDIVALFDIPANTFIQSVHLQVNTAEGGTATVDVGLHSDFGTTPTAVDIDGFLDGANLNATAGTLVSSSDFALTEGTPNTISPAYFAGHVLTADNILTLTINNALDAAIFTVWAVCVPLAATLTSQDYNV